LGSVALGKGEHDDTSDLAVASLTLTLSRRERAKTNRAA
jgi:hypothetical protein